MQTFQSRSNAFFSCLVGRVYPVLVFFPGTLVRVIHSALASSAARSVALFFKGLYPSASPKVSTVALKFRGVAQLFRSLSVHRQFKSGCFAPVSALSSVLKVSSFNLGTLSNNKRHQYTAFGCRTPHYVLRRCAER